MDQTYLGNTLLEWIRAAGIIILAFIIGRILYWIFKNLVRRLTMKTRSKLDDLLLDMVEEPIVLIVILIGMRYGVISLNLEGDLIDLVDHSFGFIITLSVTWLILRVYNAIHDEYLMPMAERTQSVLDDHLFPVMRKFFNVFFWTTGIIVALNNAGYDVTAVIAGLGVGGLAMALAMQHTFGNLVSGMLIYSDGHFKVGDRIQLKGEWGKIDGVVHDIGLRTTRVKSRYEGRLVNIPNSMLTDQDVVNVESEDGRQLFHVFKLAVGTTPEKIKIMMEILEDAVKSTEGTKELVVTGLVKVSEISSDVMHLYWVENESSKVKTRTIVNMKIVQRMQEEGIEFTDRTQQRYNKDVEY